jgi:predicted transcriptional regulator
VERGVLATVESRRLLDRLFDGRAAPMVAHLAEQGELTPADIAEDRSAAEGLKS